MEKSPQIFYLPKLQLKHAASLGIMKPVIPSTCRSSIQVFLKEVKLQQLMAKKNQQSKRQEGYKRLENNQRVYERASILQKKKFQVKDRISLLKEEFNNDSQIPNILVFKYETFWKPPHRYKTALAFYDQHLLLYGGFGSEKYMGLAKFSLKTDQWQIPKLQNNCDRQIALYGHTMGVYRHNLFIFGGVKLDSPTNDLMLINLKNEQICHLVSAPFRRKEHAMTFLNKYMLIHGGIQNGNEISNILFYFDCEAGKWSVPQQFQMPFLSHHSMLSIPLKLRKKNNSLQDILGDFVYIFGGKNQKEISQNKLHRLRVRQTGDLTTQQIFGVGVPPPRHSACFQFIQPYYLCVYGGKSDSEDTGPNLQGGFFNDCYLFDIERRDWIIPQVNLELPYRFGASSCVFKNRLFIFGGNEKNGYSDGNMLEMAIRNENKGGCGDEETNRKTRTYLRG